MNIRVGDKLTSNCGGCGLIGEMVVTKIEPVDPEFDFFNDGNHIHVTETLNDNGTIHTYNTYFTASKLVNGVLTFNNWQWTLTTQAEYAQTVYATPDEWGSLTVYADESGMQETIANLIDAGGEEWNEINLSDCAEWELMQVVNDIGIYQEQHVRRDNFVALKMADNGEYTEQKAFTSLDDAIEELSAA